MSERCRLLECKELLLHMTILLDTSRRRLAQSRMEAVSDKGHDVIERSGYGSPTLGNPPLTQAPKDIKIRSRWFSDTC